MEEQGRAFKEDCLWYQIKDQAQDGAKMTPKTFAVMQENHKKKRKQKENVKSTLNDWHVFSLTRQSLVYNSPCVL